MTMTMSQPMDEIAWKHLGPGIHNEVNIPRNS